MARKRFNQIMLSHQEGLVWIWELDAVSVLKFPLSDCGLIQLKSDSDEDLGILGKQLYFDQVAKAGTQWKLYFVPTDTAQIYAVQIGMDPARLVVVDRHIGLLGALIVAETLNGARSKLHGLRRVEIAAALLELSFVPRLDFVAEQFIVFKAGPSLVVRIWTP